ncbi:Nn.00g005900.m01.CDS01 [Neocucurbitaria sp. VM-36]
MAKVRIELEIAAPPAEVRAIILDFPAYPQWHTSFIKSLVPIPPSKAPSSLIPGDKLTATFNGSTIEPVVLCNTPREFRWRGSTFLGAFAGEHYFEFRASESGENEGGCAFVHGEDYQGWLTWLFGEGVLGLARGSVVGLYEGFSRDVKARAEGGRGSE